MRPGKSCELWQEELERIGGGALAGVISELRDGQKGIIDKLEDMSKRHTASESNIEKLNNAFPGKDPEAHRRYHQTIIDTLEEKRRLRIAIQEKTISALIWAVIVGAGSAIWREITSVVWHHP